MAEPRRVTVQSHDGLALNVWDHGGDGPVLFLNHCTGLLGRVWDPIVRLLGEHFRVIAPDMRGHGDSEHPHVFEHTEWKRGGQDVLSILDALGIAFPVRAVGHSAGGAQLGYAEWARPGTFERPILIEAIISPRTLYKPEHTPAAAARRRRNTFASLEEARQRYASKPPMSTWHPDALTAYLEYGFRELDDGSVTLKLPGELEAWFYDQGGACDLYDVLSSLQWKPLLVAGEHGDRRLLSELQLEQIAGATLRYVPGAGHFLVQEKPEAVAKLILEWFD